MSSVPAKENERFHDIGGGHSHPIFDTSLLIPNWLPQFAHAHFSLPFASRPRVRRALPAPCWTTTVLRRGDNDDVHPKCDGWAARPYPTKAEPCLDAHREVLLRH